MTWNYRIVKQRYEKFAGTEDEFFLTLREVYYNDDGKPRCMTGDGATFCGSSTDEIIDSLNLALKNAKELPILFFPDDFCFEDDDESD